MMRISVKMGRMTAMLICGALLLGNEFAAGFPDGAPGEACVKHRPNHGAKSQPLTTLPYIVQASGSEYKEGESIALRIKGKEGIYFKGFFVQAVDDKGRWAGEFEPTAFSVSHPECAATTHHDNEEKEEVMLLWHPPAGTNGTVRFMVSILKNYKIYWVDAPAIIARKSA